MLLTLTPEQIENHPFIKDGHASFYNLIQTLCNPKGKEIRSLDCTKILIANNIQDSWFENAKKTGLDTTDLGMVLLCHGPKVDTTLSDNTVLLEPNCITFEDETGNE